VRLALAALWILACSALTAGVYWGFLITPESTIWTLMISAALAVIALGLAGLTASGAIAIWWHGGSLTALRRAVRSIPGVIPAALIVLVTWWLANRVEIWIAMRSGQISAWFIARFGWDDMSWLFATIGYAAAWFRWVFAALLALSLMAGFVAIGWRALVQAAWFRRALRPRAIAAATLWFGALIALPWIYLVPWRPAGLPPTSIEFAFIAGKLSVAAVLAAVGLALMSREAIAAVPPPRDPEESAQAA
jgi:hypothetical protein